jgi:hypothetical protein
MNESLTLWMQHDSYAISKTNSTAGYRYIINKFQNDIIKYHGINKLYNFYENLSIRSFKKIGSALHYIIVNNIKASSYSIWKKERNYIWKQTLFVKQVCLKTFISIK